MDEAFCRRTLRTWAVLDAIFGTVVAALALVAIPWKWPAANLGLIALAASYLAGAPGLWRSARWAWRLAVITSLVTLSLAAAAVTGLCASWAFLRASYGAFGAGASLAALLIAAMVGQSLGLYPAIRLRVLLRREVRGPMQGGRAGAVAAIVLALVPLPVGFGVATRYGLTVLPPVPEAALARSLAIVRAKLQGQAGPEPGPLVGVPVGAGPVFVSLWAGGQPVARAQATGRDLAAAIDAASVRLQAEARGALPDHPDALAGRIKIDRVVGRAPVPRSLSLLSFALAPGLDGLSAGDETLFLPDDLLVARAAGTSAPLAEANELRVGIDPHWLAGRRGTRPLTRFRTEAWMEDGQGGAVRIARGNRWPAPSLSTARAAVAAGDFLLRQIESDGRLRYRYDPITDRALPTGSYNLPRHAGTAYGLSVLYAQTKETRFREGAAATLSWLALQIGPTCGVATDRQCLIDDGGAPLGTSALAAIAFFEYQRDTGDARFAELARGLSSFVLGQQRPDGEFHHDFDPQTGRARPGPPRMFGSEQAALALVLAGRALGEPRFQAGAARALDYLTGRKYDHFLGRFIYGPDHWTCIAANEAWPTLADRRYLDFCRGYARFMARLQYDDAPDSPNADFAGHFGFGYVMVPQAPATAGFTEALVSTCELAHRHGVTDPGLRDETAAALRALAREELRAGDNDYLVRAPERADGGIRRSLVEPEIRIDFVQHAASALARGAGIGLGTL